MTRSRPPAFSTYLLMTGLQSFLFWTTFITGSIYYIKMVGLNRRPFWIAGQHVGSRVHHGPSACPSGARMVYRLPIL